MFKNEEELQEIIQNAEIVNKNKIICVSQTTFSQKVWEIFLGEEYSEEDIDQRVSFEAIQNPDMYDVQVN